MVRWLAVLLAMLVVGEARAGEAEAAEHARLREELVRMASRTAWPGAERVYQGLVALEASGETLNRFEVYLGAQVAAANGDMLACRGRLERAQQRDADVSTAVWLRSIDQSYGPVSLRASSTASVQLDAVEAPFEPDRRAAIQAAQAALAASGQFDGLLPRGEYRFGDVRFVVDPVVPVVTVDQSAAVAAPTGPARPAPAVGPRASLGVAYTLGRPPTIAPQPPAFSGAGARGSVGIELRWGSAGSGYAELGYHGLVAPNDGDRPDALHVGFGALGATATVGRVRVGAGGVLAAGVLQATGIHDLEALATTCPVGTDDPDCAWIADVPEASRSSYLWTGSVVTPGAQAGLGVQILDVTPTLGAGLVLQGGVLFDPSRAWPWGQVAIEIAPR